MRNEESPTTFGNNRSAIAHAVTGQTLSDIAVSNPSPREHARSVMGRWWRGPRVPARHEAPTDQPLLCTISRMHVLVRWTQASARDFLPSRRLSQIVRCSGSAIRARPTPFPGRGVTVDHVVGSRLLMRGACVFLGRVSINSGMVLPLLTSCSYTPWAHP